MVTSFSHQKPRLRPAASRHLRSQSGGAVDFSIGFPFRFSSFICVFARTPNTGKFLNHMVLASAHRLSQGLRRLEPFFFSLAEAVIVSTEAPTAVFCAAEINRNPPCRLPFSQPVTHLLRDSVLLYLKKVGWCLSPLVSLFRGGGGRGVAVVPS